MITDRLLHVHVFRTGGFVFRDILRAIPGLRIIDDVLHRPYGKMATMAQEELGYVPPAVAFVRNPWAWYVSMWRYTNLYRTPPHLAGFKEYMKAIRDGAIQDPDYVRLSDHWRTIGADGRQHRGHFENLHDEIVRILVEIVPDLIDEEQIRELLAHTERHHPSEPWGVGPIAYYGGHYDEEVRKWVEQWDGELIERFGYRFENDA